MKLSEIDTNIDNQGQTIHTADDGQILFFKEGWICSRCDAQGDEQEVFE